MAEQDLRDSYLGLMDSIKLIIDETQGRVLTSDPDPFFEENVNFFVKAYLITICTYLESYLKDIAHLRVELIAEKVKQTNLPQNLIRWSLSGLKGLKKEDEKFEDLSIDIKKRQLGEHISGQPYKTLEVFKYIGLDLNKCDGFLESKEEITTIVNKRNSIIHHNDDASDITLGDLLVIAEKVKFYICAINNAVESGNAVFK